MYKPKRSIAFFVLRQRSLAMFAGSGMVSRDNQSELSGGTADAILQTCK